MSQILGIQTIGDLTDTNDPDAQYTSYYTANATGQITDIYAYVSGTANGNCRAGIFSIANGMADALLGYSNPVPVSTANQWIPFHLLSPVNVTSGVPYAFALQSDVSLVISLTSGQGNRGYASGSFAQGFQNPMSTTWWNDATAGMSIYAQITSITPQPSIGGTTSPAPGTYQEDSGSIVSVTAIPNSGYMLAHWLLDGVDVGATNPVVVTMNALHSLEADFQAAINITVTAGANGSVSPSGTYQLAIGASYQFNATPNSGFNFDYWTLGGSTYGSSNPIVIIVLAGMNNQTLSAVFAAIPQRTLTISASANGSTSPAAGTYNYILGSQAQVTAVSNSGFNFDHWVLNGINITTNPITIIMDANNTIQAVFTVTTITLNITGTNCIVTPSGTQILTIGSTYTFLALPNSGYTFSNWILGTANVGSANPYTLTAISDMNGKTLTATCTLTPPVQIQLNVASDSIAGTATPISGVFNVGSIVQFTAHPNNGYAFKQWTLNIANYTVNPLNLTITNEMSGQTLTATFTKTQILLTSTSDSNGSVAPVGAWTLNVGQTYQFTALPNSGYLFDHWDIGGQNKGSTNPISITATVEMDGATLTALFTVTPPQQITVTVAVQGNGSTDITPGTHTFNVGDTITITATPTTVLYAFKQWSINGVIYTDNPLSLPVTLDLDGQTLTAEFASLVPTQAGFPIWSIPIGAAILIGGYLMNRKGKNPRGANRWRK